MLVRISELKEIKGDTLSKAAEAGYRGTRIVEGLVTPVHMLAECPAGREFNEFGGALVT